GQADRHQQAKPTAHNTTQHTKAPPCGAVPDTPRHCQMHPSGYLFISILQNAPPFGKPFSTQKENFYNCAKIGRQNFVTLPGLLFGPAGARVMPDTFSPPPKEEPVMPHTP